LPTIAPAVIIRYVLDDERRHDPGDSLTLFPNVHNVAIDYTATSLSIASRVRFKYRLENFDKNWLDVVTRRTPYYNNLPPGRYVFRVIAANDDGVWNEKGAAVALVVPPLFFQTLWFRILCAALAAAAITALFFGRLHQISVRQRRRLEQRMEDRLTEGRPHELSADVRHDAYQIVREAVRNAYEHAKGRHIETELAFGESDLRIRVRDDGMGVDAQVLSQGQRPGRWGLPGMRERSENLGGHLNIWSKANAGTEIELRVPAAIAYAPRLDSTQNWIRKFFHSARRPSANAGQTETEN
jgi:hypothetical protein